MLISLFPPPTHMEKTNDLFNVENIHRTYLGSSLVSFSVCLRIRNLEANEVTRQLFGQTQWVLVGVVEFMSHTLRLQLYKLPEGRVPFKQMDISFFPNIEKRHLEQNSLLWATISNSCPSWGCRKRTNSLTKFKPDQTLPTLMILLSGSPLFSLRSPWFWSVASFQVPGCILAFVSWSLCLPIDIAPFRNS